ncbi:sigma 54-interacting transcriptional regulator [Eleftheria terrae]|uniref:sigma 54-interacting transcriptional regulator n=1 Tax=Eleftheria terrae TaxID=1597781 RepID=UPI00263AD7F6|nr:sigma 54-interacting transcriptional regulator [Eleftheria terrae]WKB55904.1 sigma 54-interacting transcriptional regulator [Eleftheria terrae]
MNTVERDARPGELRHRVPGERRAAWQPGHESLQVLEDPRSRELLLVIQRIGPTDAPVLLLGESGTGKDWIARALHAASRRGHGPFVAVNCGAYPTDSLEGELFGHGKGRVPGAFAVHMGGLEAGQGGTVFLDEVDRLPHHLQARLLQLLQARELVRVGAGRPLPADIRLVTATAIDLDRAVREGRFREDLYHALRAIHLRVPPLRERRRDILPLARHFLALLGERLNCPRRHFSPAAQAQLLAHDWPGNLRELENVVHHALLIGDGPDIGEQALSLTTLPAGATPSASEDAASGPALAELQQALHRLCEDAPAELWSLIERTVVSVAHAHCQQNQVKAARLLGLSRNVLRARLIAHGLIEARK